MKTGYNKYLSGALGVLCAFCLMIIFLITSVEAVAYWTPGYYEKEYTKYNVTEQVHMEMDDLLYVTDEMMSYLRGDREDLHIPTIVDGVSREFFNEREIAHMEDVRGLFLGGIALRRICILLAVISVGILIALRAPVRTLLPRMICAGTLLFFVLTAVLAGIISTDFTKYFIIFHKIFFNNDLWILDPSTDLLINIVPEPFFMDTAARIGITFGLMTAALFAVCIFFIWFDSRKKRPLLAVPIIALLMSGTFCTESRASEDWPCDVSIEADAGIVMDAGTGVVLYGKNIHETYAPASITKVLTALIVLENCSLDEIVTFSENAIYNVESNSSSAGYDTGDTASVKDCLYALLLKSANESANALAEHVAGSTEAFAVMMNEKAAQLGCQDSHFANPSGLNDENHYVSAYDMALITRAAFENDVFAEIVATTYYELPPNKLNPEGQGISPGNKMVKKNWPEQYRPDVLGGKTGYTSIALNTLVNGAQQGDTRLITVILHSQNTQYEDTSRLLDFGFANFQSVRISDYDDTFSAIGEDLTISGLPASDDLILTVDSDSRIILPKTADFSETTTSLDYELPADAPEGAIARIIYYLGENRVGDAYLSLSAPEGKTASIPEKLLSAAPTAFSSSGQDETGSFENASADTEIKTARIADSNSSESTPDLFSANESPENEENSSQEASPFHISLQLPGIFWKLLVGFAVLIGAGFAGFRYYKKKKRDEEAALLERRRRRAERLRDTGISQADFDLMMEQKRSTPHKEKGARSAKKHFKYKKRQS